MKLLLKIFLTLIFLSCILSILYFCTNYKNDYLECTYDTEESNYGKVTKYPQQTSIIHINHLTRQVYSPQDITITGKLTTDSQDFFEIDNSYKNSETKLKSRIKINRVNGVYYGFGELDYYEDGVHKVVKITNNGICKAIMAKF